MLRRNSSAFATSCRGSLTHPTRGTMSRRRIGLSNPERHCADPSFTSAGAAAGTEGWSPRSGRRASSFQPAEGRRGFRVQVRWVAQRRNIHVDGDGQEGDQSPDKGGNRALLAAPALGRPIRLFRSEGTDTTYLGESVLAEPPYYQAEAPDRLGVPRSVLVFRLLPAATVIHDSTDSASPDLEGPKALPLEATNIRGLRHGASAGAAHRRATRR